MVYVLLHLVVSVSAASSQLRHNSGLDWVTVATRKPDVDTLEANPGPECRYGEKTRKSLYENHAGLQRNATKNLLHNCQVQSLHLDDDLRGMPIGQNLLLCRCCGSVRSRRGRTPAGYGDSLRLRRTGTQSFMHYTEVKLWFNTRFSSMVILHPFLAS